MVWELRCKNCNPVARHPTYPTLFDECKTISISNLLHWGYLKKDTYKSGIIKWSCRGEPTGSVSVIVNNQSACPYLELDYRCNDKPIKYQVRVVTTSSNLGKGDYWFFICPQTGKRCRKLYLVDGYFFHRSAFSGCFYEKQTYSASKRQMDRAFALLFGADKLYEQIHSKHFKEHYKGEPTKRYKKIWSKIMAASQLNEQDIWTRYR